MHSPDRPGREYPTGTLLAHQVDRTALMPELNRELPEF